MEGKTVQNEQLEVREQEAKSNSLSVLAKLMERSPVNSNGRLTVRSQPWV